MTHLVEHGQRSTLRTRNRFEYNQGWYDAVSGAEYIHNPYSAIRQPRQAKAWGDGYIAYLDMMCGEEGE